MPGMPTMTVADSYQGVTGEGIPAAPAATAGPSTRFYVWLVLIGVVVPVLILHGLRLGGFQFVFKSRR